MKIDVFPLPRLPKSLIVAALGFSPLAHAHVNYYDLNQGAQILDLTAAGKLVSQAEYNAASPQDLPLSNPAYWNATNQAYTGAGSFSAVSYGATAGGATVDVNDVTSFGWSDGTKATLGDSHKVDFFNFRLQQDSIVNISWTVSKGVTYRDSGFSIYSGLLVYQGHDDAAVDALNPVTFTNGNIVPVQNLKDSGTVTDVQGITSAFRDTLHTDTSPYVGQFNALGSWSQGNAAGEWSALQFLQAVDNLHSQASTNSADITETLTSYLAAGNYTIAASGVLHSGLAATGLNGHLAFSYSPVPVPAAIWLFGSALAGMGLFGRRGWQSRTIANGNPLNAG